MMKPHVSRAERRALIDGFLAHDPNALDRFYEQVLHHRLEALYGCRLLFPPAVPIRFFDQQERPGLWHCLGPCLLLLRGHLLRRWICRQSVSEADAEAWILRLRTGVHQRDYEVLPRDFRTRLERLGGIAYPGIRVWSHPHLYRAWTVDDSGQACTADILLLLTLADWWDAHAGEIPLLPENDVWFTDSIRMGSELEVEADHETLRAALNDLREEFRQAAVREGYQRTGWEEAQSAWDQSEEDDDTEEVEEGYDRENDGSDEDED
ncbi:MAG TPA: hypothetical protein PKO06_03675 [Candidatus Ozemobacteraceae bacterium]|nr:hypothetical protein [Candidatus Ozemobacteraceae bacterium]